MVVRTEEELKKALKDESILEIIVKGTIGSEEKFTNYEVNREVRVKGIEDATIYGFFSGEGIMWNLTIRDVNVIEFIPGTGGKIKDSPVFTAEDNKISGLYIEKNFIDYSFIFDGKPRYRHDLWLKFIPARDIGANGYKLQYSQDSGENWEYYLDSEDNIKEIAKNFEYSIIDHIGTTTMYRLEVVGGPKDGYTSNEVRADIPSLRTKLKSWSANESMGNSDIAGPWVGSGFRADVRAKVADPDDDTIYDNEHMRVQWYRVNPATYERTAIPGATEFDYISTNEDIGYKIFVEISGDDQVLSGSLQMQVRGVVEQNKAYVTDVSDSGFTLNLEKAIPDLKAEDLIMDDISIEKVTKGKSNAIYHITADLSEVEYMLYLRNKSEFWNLSSTMTSEHMNDYIIIFYGEGNM